jgi:lauroyl/myristoyl acyltransferase
MVPLKRNKFSKINIDLCFPELNELERKNIYKKNVISSGNILFDTGVSWFWSNERIEKNISYRINGLGKLAKEQENKNGVLLFFKHSLHLELDTRILAMNCDIYGIEREHNSPEFELLQKTGRLKSMKGITDRKNTFTFIKWLKKGKTVLYAPDQDYGLKRSIEIDFFNKPAATISAPYKLVNSTGCKAYFLNSYIDDGLLILNIEEIFFDNQDEIKFTESLNNYIEEKIRNFPHEYLWQHRRFKSTLGKTDLYK